MSSCGCSNSNYENGGSYASQFEDEFDMESLMNGQGFEESSSFENSGSFGNGANSSSQGLGSGAGNLANGSGLGSGSDPNGSNCQQLPGRDRNFNRNIEVQGNCYRVANRDFYNNYVTRFHQYYVTNYRYVRTFVKDVNVIHTSTQTINCGCQHLGTTTVIANNGCGNNRSGCGCR